MRFSSNAVVVLAFAALFESAMIVCVDAKKSRSSTSSSAVPRRNGGGASRSSGGPGRRPSKKPPVSKRRDYLAEEDGYDDEDDEFGRSDPIIDDFDEDLNEELDDDPDLDMEEEDPFDDYDADYRRPPPRKRPPPTSQRPTRPSKSQKKPPPQQHHQQQPPRNRRPPPSRRYEEDEFLDDDEDFDYDRPQRLRPHPQSRRRPRPQGGRGPPPRRGAVVPYSKVPQQPSAFTRGLTAMKNSVPNPTAVKDAAMSSLTAARSTTSNLSSNLYREVKGLASSELEQVMLKATRPDDEPVKAKHVERLVKISYHISSKFDIYDAVLRKLWRKMAEKDWRTTIKALYILHSFSADGSPQHAPALKARLRELRRTHDPKRKDKFFSSKLMLAGDNNPENVAYRAFMSRYSHYVLLRAQAFKGMFAEIAPSSKPVPASGGSSKERRREAAKAAADAKKPLTSTSLRLEHYDGATVLFKAGLACQLKEGEDCEITASCVERVVSDMIGLNVAVAGALNRALKADDDALSELDTGLVRKWCQFYSDELLPNTRNMIKRMSSKLDGYGIYLPSRMGATVSPALLQKGMDLGKTKEADVDAEDEEESVVAGSDKEEPEPQPQTKQPEPRAAAPVVEEDEYDEYEYEEEEYYDDEEPF